MAGKLLYVITLLTALGFLLIGYDNGVMGGIINEEPFQTTFKKPSASLLGTIVAIYEIGCCVGSIITAFVGERLGRKRSILLGATIMLGGAGFQAGVSTAGAMIGARIVSGLGMGFLNSTMPVLQSEVSPKSSRGRFVCFQLSLLNFGIMTAYWTGYGFAYVTGSKAWRIPVALQAIFIIPILAIALCIPESPRWLAAHGRAAESLDVLSRLHGKPTDHADVVAQHMEIQNAVQVETSLGSGKWSDLLHEDELKTRRRLLIACAIQFFQQIGGINGLIFYMGNFFALVSDKPALLAGSVFTWFFAASFIPWFLIDSLGRRKLFLVCIAGMAASFAIETGLIQRVQTTSSKTAGAVATAFMFVFMGLFTIGFQANVWCYTAEIQPLRMRQKGASIATACNWITNYAVVQFTPSGIDNLGWKFYIIFAIINAAFLPPIYFFFPETKGLSLEAIDLIFAPPGSIGEAEDKAQVSHLEHRGAATPPELDLKE
ncbi:hypothetical protein IAT40_004203 [Kwoniella sp. CBS 6097]